MSKKSSKSKNLVVEEGSNIKNPISVDKNNIEDATSDALNSINSVAYADNLVGSSKDSKSIRFLDIKDKESSNISDEESSENIDSTNLSQSTDIKDIDISTDNSYTIVNKNNKSKKIIVLSFSCLFLVILLLVFSTIFALLNMNKNTIISGTYIKGINVSGLTKEQAFEKVSNIFNEKLNQSIILKHKDYETPIVLQQFAPNFDIISAINLAYSRGRTGNIFQNNFQILYSLISKYDIGPKFSYNEDSLNSLITEMQSNLEDRLIEPTYSIDGNNLIISKGKDGAVIDSNKLKSDIIYVINNLNCNISSIDIPVNNKIAGSIDINKIHNEIYKEAKDAYYTTNPYVIYPHIDGIDFAITIEEASNLLLQESDTYTIPLKILSPSITTDKIGTEAFPDLLGTYSTTYSTKNYNRSTNIRLATEKINGTVILPGETFSYNTTVGKRTSAAGFKSAAVYAGGEVTTGIGGGICQVSSTLYNSVLLSNLEIVERYNHGFNPGYVPAGRDATVSWGGPDFKFKNNRDYPVKIVSSVKNGTISIQIFGLKSSTEYEVEIQSYITGYISYKTIRKNDASLAKGKTKVLQNGSSGCKSVAYRILKLNGEVVSKTLLSQDTYNPHNKIIAVGTK